MNSLPPKRWQRVKDLFNAALDLDPEQRSGFLEGAAQGDPGILREVESLLYHHGQAGDFISLSVSDLGKSLPGLDLPEPGTGERIGPYRVLRTLGRGGMGTVYLAERADEQFQKQVAIKCIQRGMDSEFVQERFRRERQILANLEHPNIARMLDGGTTENGVAYIVMEYVDGMPVDAYCDAKGLGARERLDIFRIICGAVHYAHQNLVIHRDLKPGNILVTAESVPKLLDFGIAKLVGPEHSEATGTWAAMMTPEFASPEQVRREAISTVSDVYSLGVLLYLLMTGQRPYRFTTHAPDEVLRLVCGQEPAKPSTAARLGPGPSRKGLEGDLDTIILMAMRKEPERRYGSAEQFSEDILRYLEGRPVLARRDTFGYRASKFFQRNRASVLAATLVAGALVAGSAAALQQARAARAERAKAERRFQQVRQMADSFLFEFHDAIRDVPGTFKARQLVVTRAQEYLDSLAQEAGNDRGLQNELAMAYRRLAHVSPDSRTVVDNHLKALAINQALVAAEPGNITYRRDLANNHGELTGELRMIGDTAGAIHHGQEALRIMESLMASGQKVDLWTFDLASMRNQLGAALAEAGDPQGSLASHRLALSLAQNLVARHPENLDYRQEAIVGLISIGGVLWKEDPKAALESYHQAMALVEGASRDFPGDSVLARDACILRRKIGQALTESGDPVKGLQSLSASLRGIQSLIAADPADSGHQRVLAAVHLDRGDAFRALGKADQALASYQKSLSVSEAVMADDHARAETRMDIAAVLIRIGSLRAQEGLTAEALESLQRASALYASLHSTNPANAQAVRGLAEAEVELGEVRARVTRRSPAARQWNSWAEAARCFQQSVAAWRSLREQKAFRKPDVDGFNRAVNGLETCRRAQSKLPPTHPQ